MLDTMTRYLEAVTSRKVSWNLRKILYPLVDNLSSGPLNSAGLVITAGGSTTASTGASNFYALAKGVLVEIPSGTVLPALTGVTTPAGGWNVAVFYVNSAGVVTMSPGNPAATLGGVTFSQPPSNCALVGMLIITYASAFTGGTTPLDTATTVYINNLCSVDPTALTG